MSIPNKLSKENFDDPLDILNIPQYPEIYNEYEFNRYIRLVGIVYNIRLTKFNTVKEITYATPKPGLGERQCYKVKCPYWFDNVVCWRCE